MWTSEGAITMNNPHRKHLGRGKKGDFYAGGDIRKQFEGGTYRRGDKSQT